MSIIEKKHYTLVERRKTPFIFKVKQLEEQKRYFDDYIQQLEEDNKQIPTLKKNIEDVKQRNIKLALKLGKYLFCSSSCLTLNM
jgi:hypothetical protein